MQWVSRASFGDHENCHLLNQAQVPSVLVGAGKSIP